MSVSVTVSGDEATQVTQSLAQSESVIVSVSGGRQIVVASTDSPTSIVSETQGVVSSLTPSFAPALAAQSNDLDNFKLTLKAVTGVLNSRLDDISGATGVLNTQISGNTSNITGITGENAIFNTTLNSISGSLISVSGTAVAANSTIDLNISNADTIANLSSDLGDIKTETGDFAVTGESVIFNNLTVSGSILPENTGASIGTPSGRFKDLHLSENSIFLGDSKISFSGGASGGLTITGSGITGTTGQAKVIKLLGEDDDGRIAVQSSMEVGRKIFLGDGVNTGEMEIKGPGDISYNLTTHADGFNITDGNGAGDLITFKTPFTPDDTIRLRKPTDVQGGFFTSSGVHHSADPDTAFLFPDSNTTSILTSGVERLRVNKSGKLGIGSGFQFQAVQPSRLVHIKTHTTDDDGQHPLRVEGASSSIIELKAGDNTSLVGIDFSDNAAPHPGSIVYNHSNNSMAFDTNDATRMTISDSGHVIITGDLTVASGINIGTETVLTSGQTQTNIDTAVSNLVDSAPATLNTLNELAAALGDDANFSTTTATSLGNLSTATGNLNTRVNSNDSDISVLNTATGALTGATGALSTATGLLSTATGVLQGVTGSFAQTGSGNFGLLSVTGNISLGGNIIDTADGDILQFGTNDLIANGKHIQAGFSVGVRGNRGNTKGIDQGSTVNDLGIFCNSIEALSIQTGGNVIVNTGNLGIGTNSPQAKLHVSGNTIVSGGNLQIGSTPAYSQTRSIKLHDNGVQFGARVSLIGTNDNGGPGLEMVTDGNLSKRTLIRHEGEGSNDYGLAFFTTNGGTVSEKVRFDGNGGVGIGTSSVTAGKKLDVNGDMKVTNISASEIDSAGGDGYFIENKQFAKFENNTLKLGDHDGESFTTDIFGNGGIPMIRITGDGSQAANTFLGIGTTAPQAKLHVAGNTIVSGGNLGIGTTTPSAPLHVVGSGIVTSDFAVDTNTLFVDASANGVGIRTSSPRNLYALHVNDNFLVTNGNEDHLNIDTTSYIYKFGDISGGDNGSFFEINSANGVASINQAAFGIGVTLPQASLHVNGSATVSGGLTTLGKTTLSSHAFVTETGSFTLGNTHKGATVLLQNSASINITVPSQVSGYVTTFIAETHNPVSFITGAGLSGLNFFNGGSDIAGIYGQAQVIYKSSEYAFLGGNLV